MPVEPAPLCVVTGARGYVGGIIAGSLERQGFQVRRLSRAVGYSLDGPIDSSSLDGSVDALIHCAYDFSASSWPAIRRTNVEGSLRLLDAAGRAGVRRIVFLSSLAAYDGCVSLYGKGKLEVERAVFDRGGYAIRPGTVFGERPGGMMGSMTAQVMTKSWIPVLRHPGAFYLACDTDLATFVAELIRGEAAAAPLPWLAAGSRPWRMEELVREIARRSGRIVRVAPVPWRVIWGSLKALEVVGLRPSFRSDSVLSLAHPIPPAQLAGLQRPAFPMRDF